jgi:hypothetical protein
MLLSLRWISVLPFLLIKAACKHFIANSVLAPLLSSAIILIEDNGFNNSEVVASTFKKIKIISLTLVTD